MAYDFFRAFDRLITMPWEPVTIETAGEASAAIQAMKKLEYVLAGPRQLSDENVDAVSAALGSIIQRGKENGFTMTSPKPEGSYDSEVFNELVEFFEFRFANVELEWRRLLELASRNQLT